MKFFIDTANVQEIREAHSWGVIDGVTTNPTLVAKEKRDFWGLVEEICSVIDGPISVEVVGTEAEDMIREARELARISRNIVVKIPMTSEGLKATRRLRGEDIHCNVTLLFSPAQALLAAKAGARYVSPFIGRLDDISHSGMSLIEQIVTIYRNYSFATEVIVASIRHPLHVVSASLIGAQVATIPFKVIEQLIKHPLTDIGIEKFLADWQNVPK